MMLFILLFSSFLDRVDTVKQPDYLPVEQVSLVLTEIVTFHKYVQQIVPGKLWVSESHSLVFLCFHVRFSNLIVSVVIL